MILGKRSAILRWKMFGWPQWVSFARLDGEVPHRHVSLPSELFEGKPFLKSNPSGLPKDAYSFSPPQCAKWGRGWKGYPQPVSRNPERRGRRKAAALPSRVRTGEAIVCRNLPAHFSFSEPWTNPRTFLKREMLDFETRQSKLRLL